mmetsp:Transcript_2955/g.5476  ORF Transcript_2955/g.5476 Transcript_2955/m.5476 type:complete len:361 (-) Transcript_2955:342-1424(-)
MTSTVLDTLLVLNGRGASSSSAKASSKEEAVNTIEDDHSVDTEEKVTPKELKITNTHSPNLTSNDSKDKAPQILPRVPGAPPSSMTSPPEQKNDIALSTPTFSMPSPLIPPGISYLDLTSPPDLNAKLPAPVTLAPNGSVRNLGRYTRHGKKRDANSKLFNLGELGLPLSMDPSRSKRPRVDSSDLTSKLKSPISKEAMLPQNTPPFHAQKPPTDPVPDIDVEKEEVDGENGEGKTSTRASTPTTGTTPTHGAGPKQSAGNGSGSSCHQCKSRCSLSSLCLCKNTPTLKGKGKRQGCRKKYCDRCLNKFYNENAPTKEQQSSWACPACRGICRCAACRRQKAKHQNGIAASQSPSVQAGL